MNDLSSSLERDPDVHILNYTNIASMVFHNRRPPESVIERIKQDKEKYPAPQNMAAAAYFEGMRMAYVSADQATDKSLRLAWERLARARMGMAGLLFLNVVKVDNIGGYEGLNVDNVSIETLEGQEKSLLGKMPKDKRLKMLLPLAGAIAKDFCKNMPLPPV